MKKYLLTSLLVLLVLVGKAQEDQSGIVNVGADMPAFTIVSDNGQTLQSDSLKGKVLLVSFFATWCPPCQKELASVQQMLWPKYKDNKDFVLLVIGREHSEAELVKYNERKGFDFPLYPDKNRQIYEKFAKSVIPRSYLVSRAGKIVYVTQGYTEAEFAELITKIEQVLKK